ncbi:hypothetical protein INR49_010555 [Caranx melampygus]|nr:hypothetical protein INR49_010555 [Caranx melampygus]
MLFVFSFPSTCAWLSDSLERDSPAISEKEQRASVTKVSQRCPRDFKCGGRGGMDESYETFEEELGPTRADPPPQKPVRQIHRPGNGISFKTTKGRNQDFTQRAQLPQNNILTKSPVHPKPDADRDTMGECHSEPMSVCGYHHPCAHFRLTEASRQVV